ncbi:hypothetical protein ACLMJK_002749 [Lecanora helva]
MDYDGSKDQAPDGAINTERLILRPMRLSDADAVYAIRSDPKVFYWTTPDNREKSDEWLRARLASEKTIAHTVFLRNPSSEEDQIIGSLGAHTIPEIGYTFRPSAWGKGYATEAMKAWIQWYWSKFPNGHPLLGAEENQYLTARTGPGGDSSRNVLRKCGFKWFAEEELKEEEVSEKEKSLFGKGNRLVLEEWRLERPQGR